MYSSSFVKLLHLIIYNLNLIRLKKMLLINWNQYQQIHICIADVAQMLHLKWRSDILINARD